MAHGAKRNPVEPAAKGTRGERPAASAAVVKKVAAGAPPARSESSAVKHADVTLTTTVNGAIKKPQR
jgi:hypothetical protein